VIPPELLDRMIRVVERRVGELAKEAHVEGTISTLYEGLDFRDRLLRVCEGRAIDQRWFDPLTLSPEFGEIVTHPALLELLIPLIGPEITYRGNSHLRAHRPGRPNVEQWHQDAQFYAPGAEHICEHMAQVWLPLVDVDLENGCLAMVPGSHRWGLLRRGDADAERAPAAQRLETSSRIGDQERLRIASERARGAEVIHLPMRKGDVVVFTSLTVHTACANLSERIRWSIDLRYESTLGSRPLTPAAREGYARYHRKLRRRGYLPFCVSGSDGPGSWEDWLLRRAREPINAPH
jgi:phytanoyl-CoA hydroxylase